MSLHPEESDTAIDAPLEKKSSNLSDDQLSKSDNELQPTTEEDQLSDKESTDSIRIEPEFAVNLEDETYTFEDSPTYEEEAKAKEQPAKTKPEETTPEMSEIYRKQSDFTVASAPPFSDIFSFRSDAMRPSLFSYESHDRAVLSQMYDSAAEQKTAAKFTNNYLERQLVNYYRKKKMLHVFIRDKDDADAEKNYHKHLTELESKYNKLTKDEIRIRAEKQQMTSLFRARKREVDKLFEDFQNVELETAKMFVSSDPIRESTRVAIVDRCIRRQKAQYANLKVERLAYIKIRNLLQQVQDALDALDNLGPNLRLIDYEQMKLDNRNLNDKLEERDLEITHIRAKCQNAMQVLAHMREKLAAVNADLESMQEEVDSVNDELNDSREQKTYLMLERDQLRREIAKMKDASGLLTRPKLLKHMEVTQRELDGLMQKAKECKEKYEGMVRSVNKVRAVVNAISKVENVDERLKKIEKLFTKKPKYSISEDIVDI